MLAPIGSLLATSADDGRVLLYDPRQWQPLLDISSPDGGQVKRIAFSPQSRYMRAK